MNDTSSGKPAAWRRGRSASRTTRLVLIGGLAAGAGFAAVTGIASATSGSSTPSGATSPPGPPAPGRGPWMGPRVHPPGWGPGGGGTITAIHGTTLTLRTMNGTETVDTSSSTTYVKERQPLSFSDLRVGEVVHVATTPPSPGGSPNSSANRVPPAEPGTGTVTASRVAVVEPVFVGRVTAVTNGTYTLVGRDGRLLTVSTTGSTRYYRGTSRTTSSAISLGSHVLAEGPRDSLTHLTADVVSLAPSGPPPLAQHPSLGG